MTPREEALNTYDQLRKAGGGVAICVNYGGARDRFVDGWSILRLVAGEKVDTDKDAAWYNHGAKTFLMKAGAGTFYERRAEALERAKKWVAATYGERGPWKRNRMGDFVPERIAAQFPLRRRTR